MRNHICAALSCRSGRSLRKQSISSVRSGRGRPSSPTPATSGSQKPCGRLVRRSASCSGDTSSSARIERATGSNVVPSGSNRSGTAIE